VSTKNETPEVEEEEPPEEVKAKGKMPIGGHFNELRQRFTRGIIALVVGVMAAFFFATPIIGFLTAPGGPDFKPAQLGVMEYASVFFNVSLWAGFILASPYILYQLIAFITPALNRNEKKFIFISIPAVTVMFLAGLAFAYYVALPPALNILLHWGDDVVLTVVGIKDYMNVVTRILIALGLIFETPFIIMVLARLGVVSPKWLASKRKIWVVIAFVIAALITPTFDPVNQTIMAGPLIVLYEISIWLSKLVYRKKREVIESK
jgi:sec-independent protein translocase protein TatC